MSQIAWITLTAPLILANAVVINQDESIQKVGDTYIIKADLHILSQKAQHHNRGVRRCAHTGPVPALVDNTSKQRKHNSSRQSRVLHRRYA